MKNLIKAIEAEQKNRLNDFVIAINQIQPADTFDIKELQAWQYKDLIPKGKDVSNFTFSALKGYLIMRKEKATYKAIERQAKHVDAVSKSGVLIDAKINVEWTKSRTWGANPSAECWYSYELDGRTHSGYVKSGSVSGCGYDKLSTAVAYCLNQINEVLKPMYLAKDKANFASAKSQGEANQSIFGYGSGYGILPSIEGGVGVSCYDRIFNAIGYEFKSLTSGKMFDSYIITKKAKTAAKQNS